MRCRCTTHGCGGAERGRRAELFDPVSGRFEPAGSMTTPRVGHTATPLPDGRILLTGGWPGENRPPLASAEIYDPATGTFTATGPMRAGRGGHVAAPLPGGRVLVAGGSDPPSAEIFDPRTGHFAPAATPAPGEAAVAVPLRDGRVLVAGGEVGPDAATPRAQVYDPAANRWLKVEPMRRARAKMSGVRLRDGRVLIAGGAVPDGDSGRPKVLDDAEIFDPATGKFHDAKPMHHPRYKITDAAVVLQDGQVLIAGGSPQPELFDPATGRFRTLPGRLDSLRWFATTTPLPDGRVLLIGGYDQQITPRPAAYLFTAP